MPDPFAVLRERLLRAGVRPRTVSRYVSELREHLDDLTLEFEAEGFPTEEARQRAYSRLGSIDTLAMPMISDRRFHSWAARTPWAVFVLAPIVGYGLIVALLTLALVSVVLPGAAPGWFGMAGRAAGHFSSLVLPVIAAWLLAFTALRQRSRPLWPLLGIVLTIAVATMTQLQIQAPGNTIAGEIAVALAVPSATQLTALLLAAFAPLLLLHKSSLAKS